MPIDKQPKGPPNKPITPALSSRFRTTKTPIAPKLAGSSSSSSPVVTIRKDLQEQTTSPATDRKQAPSLNDNITPRSGARNTRISTDSPTSPGANRRFSGTGSIQGIISPAQRQSVFASPTNGAPRFNRLTTQASSPNLSTARRISGSSTVSKKDDELAAKFFHINDATPTTTRSPKSALNPRPFSAALLRNGSPRVVNSAPQSVIDDRNSRKDENLVRASAVRPPVLTRKQSAASVVSATSTKARPIAPLRTQTEPQPRAQPISHGSPAKSRTTTTASQPSVADRPSPLQSPSAVISSDGPSNRRGSFGSDTFNVNPVRPLLHRKSASVSTFSPPSRMIVNLPTVQDTGFKDPILMSPTVLMPFHRPNLIVPSPETLSPRSASLASSKTMGTSVTSDTDVSEVSKTGLPYPILMRTDSSTQSKQQIQSTPLAQAQADASNARRERKVLDLEISNSSLLAINKTLEKELRKQSAELRRFRRLSRSGRLSLAPTNRSISGQSAISLDTLQEQTEDESEQSDEEEEESDTDGVMDEGDGTLDDSFGRMTARARRRARDEQRLMLDLSKHQQLLIDSQKLSQTIRKCLSISEDLIKEGNQALAYKVGIGDIKLGGRVLTTEDLEISNDLEYDHQEENESRKGLLSPSLAHTEIHEAVLQLAAGSTHHEPMYDYFPHGHDWTNGT